MRTFYSFLLALLLVDGVFGVEKVNVTVSVMRGDSVTLNSSTEIPKDDSVEWWFGEESIAQMNKAAEIFSTYNGADGRFRDRLKLDKQTGSLTITNITTEHTGLYELKIKSRIEISKIFSITVHGEMTVSVMEGEPVILYTGVIEIQGYDLILWKFGDHLIAEINKVANQFLPLDSSDGERFKGRLQMHRQYGDLTVRGSRTTDSGVYHLHMNSSSHTVQRSISVTVSDKMKTESVMEGDSVTLNPDLTQIQGINPIQWRFGASGSVIAETVGNEISYPHFTEIFGGRLQLDHQTGSLIIKNMRTKHSGLYQLEINHNTGSSRLAFIVTVSESPPIIDVGEAEMKSVPVKEGDSVTLQTDVTETHGDELFVWRFGDEGKLIAKCDLEAKSSPLYETDERFRDRQLDHQTGSLTITHTRTTDSGFYTVKISSNKQMIYKRFNVTVSDPGLSAGAVAGIVVAVLLVVVFAPVAGVIYHRRKISELQSRRDV